MHLIVSDVCGLVPHVCVQSCMFVTHSFTACALGSLQKTDYDYVYETYDDEEPVNCSVTESIKGGHVTYSKVTKVICAPGGEV